MLAELTYNCPLKCGYCSNPTDYKNITRKELNTKQWKRVLKEGHDMGIVQLGFSGGEPLTRTDIIELVEYSSNLGFYTNLITSGIGLTKDKVNTFKQVGLDSIQISFQDSDKVINDMIAGRSNAFEEKMEIAEYVKDSGFPLTLNIVLHKQNIENIEDIIKLCIELKADFVELANTQFYGWAFQNKEQLLPTFEQVQKAKEITNKYQQDFFDKKHKTKFFYVMPDYYSKRPKKCMDGWGSQFIIVGPDGAVLPCHNARVIPNVEIPTIDKYTLGEIWSTSELFNKFRAPVKAINPVCSSCPEYELDEGGCRCQAMMLTGDPYATDPVCEFSPHNHEIQKIIHASENNTDMLSSRE